ncbi:A-kinase anchor protein 11 isoform X2 [Homo sapiens]|uniref:A-kinase anchor protein 11 isoform X2 n=1 Tax=Homo sapiens TaxID=9606 RepID=UPI00001FCCBD|nr:A-kinase anchor protein 11 isoform X2 [Homo sapiens]XP_047286028.1 A-kinase anchor protein 11 isoform X2 [Homo sapiens]XP_047286029.1 A-kinase anchor protein 11 isoform X2 [Homo sapiens]XP_047286030.1 A-kinase anchor protein 11 isoform X2 [Homo sapiens]XP_047286031.1 A-kinase anchor protein 11 isoform X2 [Homo sapiens]XP_054230043.1 A-kinase anchor protein 11 isoform X2 [Homo sapiens]XP_054230044.1 A-kinase anchor protein 11 isoform X2 [Homo sapiens]XP_054230045.1 A-kinase anchor protein |eukprot:XP_005266304.1 A-kinase anchor protein 11 isoform X2 [Homo sapiens]
MATFRNNHMKTKASVRKSFSEDVFQSVKSLLQSQKELCSVTAEDCLQQDEHANLTEVTFLGFNEETDAAHIQDLAAVSLELPDILNSLHFCSLNENEIICMKNINKPLDISSDPLNQSHPSGMLCVMRVSPTSPRLRIDFIFSLLSKYATGIRYTLDTFLHQKHQLETTDEDDDDTNQSVSSIEDDFVTAFEHLEEEETSKPYNDGMNITVLRSQCDAASQTVTGHHLETHDLKILISSGQQKSLAKPSTSSVNVLGHKELPSVKTSVTTSISEPWTQRSFYRSSNASDKDSDLQKTFFSSSPAYSSESECSSPSPVIFLDEEGYQKSLKAKLELPKIPVMKDDIEDSDSEVSEFFDSFDQFDELEQTLETCLFNKDPVIGKSSQRKGHKHGKSCMNPQKFKFDRPALPANVRKPTPRKPESPYGNLCDAPDSPRPVKASREDSGLFSPIRSSAFSPLGGCTPAECFCQTDIGGDRIHENHDSVYYTYEDYAKSISCEVLGSVLRTHHTNTLSNINSIKHGENKTVTFKHGNLDQKNKSKNKSLMIKDSIQKFAADLVEKSFGSAFKDLQKGVSSCTNALYHLAIKLTSSVLQMAFDELRRQRAFSLKERAISGLANFLVSEALSNALKDLQYVKKQIFTNTVARFAADLAEELVFEGIMEVCQFSYPQTPASPQCGSFDFEDKVVKLYAKDLSESVIQEAFIELSQVDVTFTTKAAVSVSTDNIKYVSAESVVPSTQAVTFSPSFHNQAIMVTKPVQEYKKEYTVQQALFCTSGIVTSIPVPLAGSALLPYHISSTACQAKAHLSSDDSNSNGDSAQVHIATKNREEKAACLRNICLPSEHNPGNQNDFKPTNDDIEMQSSSKLPNDPAIISNFSAAVVHTIVNETLESMTSLEVTKMVDERTDYLTKSLKEKTPPFSHCDQAVLQCSEASSNKDMFADRLSKSIIKHSIDKSKSVIPNIDKNAVYKESLPVSGEESQLTPEKSPKFPDSQNQLTHCSLSAAKDCVPECKVSMVHGSSLETLPSCPAVTGQKSDLKESAKDQPLKKHNLNSTSLEALSFGQENPFPHSHTFSSTALTCVDGLHVEDKQKVRDRNVIPDTPPSTPLVPSRASSEWDIKKLTKKLKGELAKEFAPATPPSTPHNSSVGSLSENEQNTIEKEEFMLKLMRSLSEEVESSESGELPEVDVKSEHSGKKVQFAEALATHILSLATEMAASHLDNKIIQEPKVKNPCLNVQSQRSVSPTFLNPSDENLKTLCNFAGDLAAEVITEAEKIAKVRNCMLFKQKKNSCYADGDEDYKVEEKLDIEAVVHPREVDPFILSLPPSSCMSGLMYKYPSCESVTDEYAGHLIQILKQEGGNSELIMDQYANRLAYRSVKSGLQEAAKTTKVQCNSRMFPVPSSQVKTNKELLMFSNKEHHQEADKKRQSKRNEGYFCKNQTCERTLDPYRNEVSQLYSFSTSLVHSITKDAKEELTASLVGLPKSLTDSCLFEKSGYEEDNECHVTPELPKSLQPSSQNHRFYHSTGSLNGYGCGDNVVQAVEQYAKKVVDDTLELTLGSTVFRVSETTKSADRVTYAEKLSPLTGQACRYCDLKELHNCTGNSSQHFFRQGSLASSKPASNPKFSSRYQKSRIFHLSVPQIHVNLDKKAVLAEKIVAEAIEKAERELSSTSLAADSGIGQEGASFAESLATETMTAAVTNVGHAVSSSKEIEDFQSTESVSSQQMNLSIGDDSTGSWSNLSFEDEHQDESSSFHHLSESDGPDDKDEEHEDEVEGLGQDGKTLLITNIDMEPCTVDPQLRIILQWLIASEAEVAELYFHDSANKEFMLLSKQLQEKGWKVGDLLQAVLQYYEVMEKASSEERCKSLFDWLLENA